MLKSIPVSIKLSTPWATIQVHSHLNQESILQPNTGSGPAMTQQVNSLSCMSDFAHALIIPMQAMPKGLWNKEIFQLRHGGFFDYGYKHDKVLWSTCWRICKDTCIKL